MTLQQALLQSFEQYSDRTAMESDSFSMRYGELYQQASRIASFFIAHPYQNERIALLFSSSESYVIGMIGVLLSKNIFIPLDCTYPERKITRCLDVAGCGLILTDKKMSELAILKEKQQNMAILYLEDLLKRIELTQSFPTYHENDGIYLYFTSGSTGLPKAILGRNESLLHFIQWEIREFQLSQEDVVAQLTSPAFDPYLRDIFVPLCAGATISLINRKTLLVPRLFGRCLSQCNITVLHTTPTVFSSLMRYDFEATQFDQLRYILIAGELLSAHSVKQWYATYGSHTELVNLYGPTETTLAKVFYRIPYDFQGDKVPVGQPIEGAKLQIVDPKTYARCSNLEVGEVCIETDFMTHGYYNDSANPPFILSINNEKSYATGDLGWIDHDLLYLLGRQDDQVKIGATRIHLNEIKESILNYDMENIQQCIVIYHNESLVAFYQAADEITVGDLRRFLEKDLLPIHIPTEFIWVDMFPLTENGKIDRTTLLLQGGLL